ncbi:GTP-binding protein [Magnetofaba australis]|uniref:G domain-containing protein n=1 Tax=Magnetofaba australis IT-1 TaxID=1434232 RepID=A0A1Y2JZX7_9PROT|nr:GTP-binding protein [Magnetofaba australis]OSM00389.1 hypothetical protein MAIT1_00897 [Magnetofaba australis IT-1]
MRAFDSLRKRVARWLPTSASEESKSASDQALDVVESEEFLALRPDATTPLFGEAVSADRNTPFVGETHLHLSARSLRELLDDPHVPESVRYALRQQYDEVEAMLHKVNQGHIHIAAFGRVSVGKSSLLNALMGEKLFSTSPLHGETREARKADWREAGHDGVFVIDTPGINEIDGEERERLAREVAARSDIILFVVDGDLTNTEYLALADLLRDRHRPVALALNKADRYVGGELPLLLETLRERVRGAIDPQLVIPCAAQPSESIIIETAANGAEIERRVKRPPDLAALKNALRQLLSQEGKSVAAVNAAFQAGRLSDEIAQGVTAYHKEAAERVIHTYCLGKGAAVAFNPIPAIDLLAIMADAAMILNLSRVYNLPMSRTEAGTLIKTIMKQMAVLMGTVFTVQAAASVLKGASMGFSTIFTAGAQGAVAYYGAYVVGKSAQEYLALGKSWGSGGPKQTVRKILDSVDQETLLAQARQEILAQLSRRKSAEK